MDTLVPLGLIEASSPLTSSCILKFCDDVARYITEYEAGATGLIAGTAIDDVIFRVSRIIVIPGEAIRLTII
jgi:hypothetical protein